MFSRFACQTTARRWFHCLLVTSPLLLVGLAAASVEANEMAAWKKNDEVPSYFVDLGDQRWLEVEPSGKEFRFEELERKDQQVELIDRRRNIKVNLHADYAELSMQGKPYVRWRKGEWVKSEDLPDYAQVSPVDHKVRLIYFVPTDREPTANFREKINTLMHIVNETYKYEFRRRGLPDRGLVFETDDEGVPIVHLLHGKNKAQYYNGAPNYDPYFQLRQLRPEIPKSIGNEHTHLVVTFLETYDSGPNQFEWPGGIALGGWRSADGGTANFSAWVLQDMFCATNIDDQKKLFRDRTPIEGRTALGHGRKNSPRFEFIEDGMGAVIHEVGHALGLPHDQRDDRHYIMGNGFRKMSVNLDENTPVEQRARFSDANARILAQSRLLNPEVDLTDRESPKFELSLSNTDQRNVFKAKVKATDDKGLRAVLFFDDVRGSVVDGDDMDGQAAEKELELELRKDEKENSVRLEVKVVDQGGNISTARVTHKLP